MRDERGEGRGPKNQKDAKEKQEPIDSGAQETKPQVPVVVGDSVAESLEIVLDRMNTKQIEYLLFQSTQGLHFIFENLDIAHILRNPVDDRVFFTEEKMKKVQRLLSGLLDCATLQEKRSYLERLGAEDFELLVRSYFHLVENTILAHSDIRH